MTQLNHNNFPSEMPSPDFYHYSRKPKMPTSFGMTITESYPKLSAIPSV